jgi:spore coat-associated protein N
MRKIIVSLSLVAGVAAIAAGSTFAFFSDTATSSGNSFSAGTLSLSVDGGHTISSGKFVYSNLKPGDSSPTNNPTVSYTVNNTGSIDGFLNLTPISVVGTAGTGVAHTPAGYGLGSVLNIVVKVGGVTKYSGTLDGFNANAALGTMDVALAHGASTTVTIDYSWTPGATDNGAQGDSAAVSVGFNLSQNSL